MTTTTSKAKTKKIESLSPKAVLSRGYALLFDQHGRLLKDSAQLQVGTEVRAQLGHGEFSARVTEVSSEIPKSSESK